MVGSLPGRRHIRAVSGMTISPESFIMTKIPSSCRSVPTSPIDAGLHSFALQREVLDGRSFSTFVCEP